jgi:hypothetical protein
MFVYALHTTRSPPPLLNTVGILAPLLITQGRGGGVGEPVSRLEGR